MILSILLFVSLAEALYSQALPNAPNPSGVIDAAFAQWNRPDSAGCAVGVIREGSVVHQKGYGMANLEHDIPITPQTKFYLGSTSKEFTAMAVLLLVGQGKMKLEDPIRKYIPDLPAYMQPVTVRHLLEHSSGIRDYHGLWTLSGPENDAPLSDAEVMGMLRRQKGLQFTPGDEFLYSNSNYFLLGTILRPAAFRQLGDLAEEQIFKPLGMKNTLYYSNRFRLLPKRATGYSPGNPDPQAPPSSMQVNTATVDVIGDGGVFTTLEDAFQWFQFFDKPPGPYAQALDLMKVRGKLNSGDESEYGRGLMIKKFRGLDAWSHAGGLRGYRSEMLWLPEKRLGVAVLCNTSGITPAVYARVAADAFLGQPAPLDPPKLTPAELARKAGTFFDPVTGDIVQIAPQGPVLSLNYDGTAMTLLQRTKTVFRSVNAPLDVEIEFRDAGEKDEPRFLRVESETHRPVKWERIEVKPVPLENPPQYEGVYWCEEAQAQVVIRYVFGKLTLEQKGTIGELQLVRPDLFRVGTMHFRIERNAEKKVTAFHLNTGRVRALEFKRTADQPPNQ